MPSAVTRRPERLRAALSANGHLVHLARADGLPVCGTKISACYRVHARVTCPGCRRRRPEKTKRLERRPYVIGVDHSPLYAALQRALESGAPSLPRVRVRFWPVLAS